MWLGGAHQLQQLQLRQLQLLHLQLGQLQLQQLQPQQLQLLQLQLLQLQLRQLQLLQLQFPQVQLPQLQLLQRQLLGLACWLGLVGLGPFSQATDESPTQSWLSILGSASQILDPRFSQPELEFKIQKFKITKYKKQC